LGVLRRSREAPGRLPQSPAEPCFLAGRPDVIPCVICRALHCLTRNGKGLSPAGRVSGRRPWAHGDPWAGRPRRRWQVSPACGTRRLPECSTLKYTPPSRTPCRAPARPAFGGLISPSPCLPGLFFGGLISPSPCLPGLFTRSSAASADMASPAGVLGVRRLRRTDRYDSASHPYVRPLGKPSPRSRDEALMNNPG